jgi:hypothetical protein
MISVDLNDSEYKSLMDPKWRRGNPPGGFQNLMIDLCNGTDQAHKRVYLNQKIMKRMRRYAFNYGSGGWEDGLLFIFGRTLGRKLDRYLLPEDDQPDLF